MYIFGSAGSARTYQNNLDALEQWRIIPRMLRNATDRNLEVSRAPIYFRPLPELTRLPP